MVAMESDDEEWGRKGATLSDKTARSEYGLTQDEIFAAIDAGKLQYRPASMHGNPWLRLLRREVEELVRTRQGEPYLRERQARTELAQDQPRAEAAPGSARRPRGKASRAPGRTRRPSRPSRGSGQRASVKIDLAAPQCRVPQARRRTALMVPNDLGSSRGEEHLEPSWPVGFQNSAMGPDLGFYAARSYSLMRPPRTGRHLIRFRERSATGWSGRGGRSWRLR